MKLITILAIAVGLAMDAFAVSITSGLTMKKHKVRYALRIALWFGAFQALMPVLGFMAGLTIRPWIEPVDHWIAFGLLAYVGGRMLREAFHGDGEDRCMDPDDFLLLFTLSVATSIDALAVGLSLSLLNVNVLKPALIIGLVTFCMSFAGVQIGKRMGHFFERRAEMVGGIILIFIGIRILVEHLGG